MRFGVIGTNWITDRFLQAAQSVEDFALTAVYSRTEERARAYADQWSIPHRFTELAQLAKSDELDAVYIATPNSLHAEHAIQCMQHGKHVLCEKPLASNAAEVRAMQAAAQDNGVLLMEAMKSTCMPGFEAVQAALPRIGRVRRYYASYCQYSSRYDAYRQGTVLNAFNPTYSNGAMMDLGIYCLYPLLTLFGAPTRIQATGYMLESGVDGEGSMVLTYPDMDAVIMYSKITSSSLPSEIQGEDGTLVMDSISEPHRVQLRLHDGTLEDLTRAQPEPPMAYELREFIRTLQAGRLESSINSFARSLATITVMDEARRQLGLVYEADRRAVQEQQG
ncbi:Gfo/Idh/MocA family protein [Paenibacillus sp. YYML68]|uniref:Gfo/Idh/MocA family protein n=1 Tax=Paenibacillus sp. YYML68 TaxID=2909250 RepID=UPI002490086D|nr:Gfo/Idh/MocA family oxidoreductase [Paenibacillus sp. YYML68]